MLGHDIILGTPTTYMVICTANHTIPETSLSAATRGEQSNFLAVSLDKHQNPSIPSAQSSLVRLHIHAPSRPIKVAAQ